MIGKNGFLFLAGADANDLLDHFTGTKRISAAALNVWRYNGEGYGKASCLLAVIVVPEAHIVYQEYLPDHIALVNERPVHQALPLMGGEAVYLLDHLLAAKYRGLKIYTGNDSHWTEPSAFEAYRAVRRLLLRPGSWTPQYQPSETRETGDLRLLSGAEVIAKEQRLRQFAQNGFKTVFANGILNHGGISVLVNPSGSGRCLAFGTSFSTRLAPAYASDFKEVVLCYGTAMDESLAALLKPDAIIVELPERFVHYPSISVSGSTLVSAFLASRESSHSGIHIDRAHDLADDLRGFRDLARTLSRPDSGDAAILQAVVTLDRHDPAAARAMQAVISVAKRTRELRALRVVASGGFRRKAVLSRVYRMIDQNEVGFGELDLLPFSEMGLLAKTRLMIRTGLHSEAARFLEEAQTHFGDSSESNYYGDYIRNRA